MTDSQDVFSFMQSNGVGTKMSLFWIAWAFIAEKSQNYQLADNLFQNGIREGAEPKSLLSQRYQQFQRRITRKYLTAMENGEDFAPLPTEPKAPKLTASSGSFKPAAKFSAPTATTSSVASTNFEVFADVDTSVSFGQSAALPKKARSFLANENQRLKENMGKLPRSLPRVVCVLSCMNVA